jgi:D-sedoheptulose 7-phosphate isomerase
VHAEQMEQRVKGSIRESIETKERLLDCPETIDTICQISQVLIDAFRQGNKVLLFGNGGSAADAQHIAAEFVGRFLFDRAPLPALALSVNSSCVTAIGNDYGYDLVFSRQLEALGRAGDVAIGISTSGSSANVLSGLLTAKKLGIRTVAFAGGSGGKMREAAEFFVCAPSPATPRIQECHILLGHVIADLVEQTIFNG